MIWMLTLTARSLFSTFDSGAPSSCMPPILLPLSALRGTNGPDGRNPHLPFEQYSAQARPPISLNKVTLEEQGVNVLFHTKYNTRPEHQGVLPAAL